MMDDLGCPCPGRDNILMKYQYISDFFIALAYFSIPLELIYFVKKSSFFPYRWVLIQFGAFIVLCGATHLINLWTVEPHSETLDWVMTTSKVSTAVISCATALMLVHVIPDLLSAKMREFFLKVRAEELDRIMGIMQNEKEMERNIRVLIQEIRASMDRPTILQTAMIGFGRTFGLEECALWTPSPSGFELRLSQTLRHHSLLGSAVSLDLPVISNVCNTNQAMRIPHTSPLARICPFLGRYVPPEVLAVRVPLSGSGRRNFAVMVLMLPPDSAMKWRPHELELVPVVADQIAAALAQAAILESASARSQLVDQRLALDLAQSQLAEQNKALDMARREAERAVAACNNFLAVMNHGMRTPLQSIISLSSFLLEADLAPELRMMVETVLKSSTLMASLLHDAFDAARLQNGDLQLEPVVFNLHSLFREVVALVRPIAAVKKLSVTLTLAPDLPSRVVGDAKRLATIILHIAANAVKFTDEGFVSIAVSTARGADSLREGRLPESFPPSGEPHCYLRIQVKDSGCGISPQDLPRLFNKFSDPRSGGGGGGLGLALCKRFANLMGGQISLESEGLQRGSTAVLLVKLGLCCDNGGHPVDSLSPCRAIQNEKGRLPSRT